MKYQNKNIEIGSTLTIHNINIYITEELDSMSQDSLKFYETLLQNSYWKFLKEDIPKIYWETIFRLMSDFLNDDKKERHFISYSKFEEGFVYSLHRTVEYNLIYFSSLNALKKAKQLMSNKIWYVV